MRTLGARTIGSRLGRPRGRRAGVTLLEMLTVLVIIGVVAAFGLPRLDYSRYRADAGARMVRGALQQAQRNAIQRQHDVLVSFDVTRNRIRIVEDMNNDQQVSAGERVVWRPLEEGARFATPGSTLSGVRPTSAVVGPNLRAVNDLPTVVFHNSGSASSDVEIYLTTARSAASDFRAIQVTQSTGRVDWFRNSGSAWRRDGV